MNTIDERQRTCSYCGGEPFPTREAFSEHFGKCPARIRAGHIPTSVNESKEKIKELREKARRFLETADSLEAKLMAREPIVRSANDGGFISSSLTK